MAVQRHPAPDDLAQSVFRLLGEEGHWHLVDVVPASMPGHGVFAFFPDAWPYAHGSFWTAYNFYNVLRRTGFQLNQQEHVFYWPVTLGVALEIVRRRPGLLAILPDELYQQGVRRLEAATEERGADTLIPSELTVVEVMAVKRKSEEAEEAMEGDDKGQK